VHKYTHGGTPQLARRNSGWSEDEVMRTLVRADLFAILAARLDTVIEPNPTLSSYGFGQRDQRAEEMTTLFRSSANSAVAPFGTRCAQWTAARLHSTRTLNA
jgi:hypothetical protein